MGKIKKVKATKPRNKLLSTRQKPFNSSTIPDRSLEGISEEPVASSAGLENSHAHSSLASHPESAPEETNSSRRPPGQSTQTRNLNKEKNYNEFRAKCVLSLQKPAYFELQERKAALGRDTLKGFLADAALRACC